MTKFSGVILESLDDEFDHDQETTFSSGWKITENS